MPNLVVVAIPSADDHVWEISSEKVPHMTILFLGEMPVENFASISNFVSHASQRSLTRFGMEVDRRGPLGPDPADVLYFDKSKWSGYEQVAAYRSTLLQNDAIRKAYESVEQFPDWVPHLTMGYPETPAKKDTRDYPGVSYVRFDRIGLWFSEYDGLEFRLRDPMEAMAETAMGENMGNQFEAGMKATEQALIHYGVKGMKWGVRKDRSSRVTVSAKGRRLTATGGTGRKPSSDARRVARIGQQSKKSGYQSLTNAELRAYIERKGLEKRARDIDNAGFKAAINFIKKHKKKVTKVATAAAAAA